MRLAVWSQFVWYHCPSFRWSSHLTIQYGRYNAIGQTDGLQNDLSVGFLLKRKKCQLTTKKANITRITLNDIILHCFLFSSVFSPGFCVISLFAAVFIVVSLMLFSFIHIAFYSFFVRFNSIDNELVPCQFLCALCAPEEHYMQLSKSIQLSLANQPSSQPGSQPVFQHAAREIDNQRPQKNYRKRI